MRPDARLLTALVAASVLGLVACGSATPRGAEPVTSTSSPSKRASRSTSTSTTSATTATAVPVIAPLTTVAPTVPRQLPPTVTTAPCSFDGTTGRREAPATEPGTFLLTDVRLTAGACTDSITFTFSPTTPAGAPPYVVEPASPPFAQAASGQPIALPGSTFLRVKFQPSWTADLDTGVLTYTGSRDIVVTGAAATRAVVLYDAYEGVVGWFVGLDGSGKYTVTTATAPPSLTITVGR